MVPIPNHESNNVVILGAAEAIDALLASGFVREPTQEERDAAYDAPTHIIDFNAVVPQPDNIERGSCSGEHAPGVICWYRWNIAHWNTKWGAYNATLADRVLSNRLNLRFQTALSAPTPIYEAIEKNFGLVVRALCVDEGGFPDTFYGDQDDVMDLLEDRREVSFSDYTPEVWGQYPSDN